MEPCDACNDTGTYETNVDGADVECFCLQCEVGLDRYFASGDAWAQKASPQLYVEYLNRKAAKSRAEGI